MLINLHYPLVSKQNVDYRVFGSSHKYYLPDSFFWVCLQEALTQFLIRFGWILYFCLLWFLLLEGSVQYHTNNNNTDWDSSEQGKTRLGSFTCQQMPQKETKPSQCLQFLSYMEVTGTTAAPATTTMPALAYLIMTSDKMLYTTFRTRKAA